MKNKLPNFLVKKSPWPWRSACSQPRTLSFRTPNDVIFKTINSAYDDDDDMSSLSSSEDDQIEAVVRGLPRRGERLFLELEETSSIMAVAEAATVGKYEVVPFKESVALAVESKEPYLDFKKSMEEMVEALELKDWKAMEALFAWYLNANGQSNHHFIIAAFVDLLLPPHHNLPYNYISSYSNSNSSCSCCFFNNSSSSSSSFSSSDSCCSSFGINATPPPSSCCIIMEDIECSSSSIAPCLSSLFEDDEEEEEQEEDLQQQHF